MSRLIVNNNMIKIISSIPNSKIQNLLSAKENYGIVHNLKEISNDLKSKYIIGSEFYLIGRNDNLVAIRNIDTLEFFLISPTILRLKRS